MRHWLIFVGYLTVVILVAQLAGFIAHLVFGVEFDEAVQYAYVGILGTFVSDKVRDW